jgi:hypothetical protein
VQHVHTTIELQVGHIEDVVVDNSVRGQHLGLRFPPHSLLLSLRHLHESSFLHVMLILVYGTEIHGAEAICRLCNKNDVNLIPSVLKICVGMGCCVAAELLSS